MEDVMLPFLPFCSTWKGKNAAFVCILKGTALSEKKCEASKQAISNFPEKQRFYVTRVLFMLSLTSPAWFSSLGLVWAWAVFGKANFIFTRLGKDISFVGSNCLGVRLAMHLVVCGCCVL